MNYPTILYLELLGNLLTISGFGFSIVTDWNHRGTLISSPHAKTMMDGWMARRGIGALGKEEEGVLGRESGVVYLLRVCIDFHGLY